MPLPFRRRATRWGLGAPRLELEGGTSSVVADLPGGPVRFTRRGGPLVPAAEAFAGLLLYPALRRGAVLDLRSPLDPLWLEGARHLLARWRKWWGGRAGFALAASEQPQAAPAPAAGHGLCFTAGVDSFYTLLGDLDAITHLVYVHGYDVPLGDRVRMGALRGHLEAVADALGKTLVVLETDLRENPVFAAHPWERTHGAALAAAGHLLQGELGTLTFGPSWRLADLRPWGTHPETDGLFSSRRLAVRPGPATDKRDARVRRVARSPLALAHLHVCWERRTEAGNCGRCEKCVRTMVALAGLGALEACATFEHAADLPARIAALPPVGGGYDGVWRFMLDLDLPPPVRSAVEDLLARSR